jgi:hypothetical protein
MINIEYTVPVHPSLILVNKWLKCGKEAKMVGENIDIIAADLAEKVNHLIWPNGEHMILNIRSRLSRATDLDGPNKPLQDAIAMGLQIDDAVVAEIHAVRDWSRGAPYIEVLIQSKNMGAELVEPKRADEEQGSWYYDGERIVVTGAGQ